MSMKKSKVSSCSMGSHFWVQIKIHVLMQYQMKVRLTKSEKYHIQQNQVKLTMIAKTLIRQAIKLTHG